MIFWGRIVQFQEIMTQIKRVYPLFLTGWPELINKAKIVTSDVFCLGTQYQTIFALFDNIVPQGSRVFFVTRRRNYFCSVIRKSFMGSHGFWASSRYFAHMNRHGLHTTDRREMSPLSFTPLSTREFSRVLGGDEEEIKGSAFFFFSQFEHSLDPLHSICWKSR